MNRKPEVGGIIYSPDYRSLPDTNTCPPLPPGVVTQMSREQALEKRIADLEEGLRKALEYIDQSIEDLQRRLREKQPCTNCGGRGTVYSVWYRSDIACTDCNGSGMY